MSDPATSPQPGVPPQPTLRDGDLVLRPWSFDDVEAARLQHDDEIAHWFGFPEAIPPAEKQRKAIERWHADYADGRKVVSFVVEHRRNLAGTVEVKQRPDEVGELSWAIFPRHRGQGLATRAVRLLIDYSFGELGLSRVQAYAEPQNLASLRTAGRAGLRREGIVRGREEARGERRPYVQLARLATDPEPTSPLGFRAVLNAGLPTKRVIAQGLGRNSAGGVLLCELTYKREWDLPGGVVDPHESPAHAVVREIREELGVDMTVAGLTAVNWLPAWRGWDDACLFVFDLGVHDDGLVQTATLEPREIRALHWCSLEQVGEHGAAYLTRMLTRLLHPPAARIGTAYLEDGADPT
ncbi:MAG: NUDIX hydrolase [Nocardioidaceae bacterium]|nr:NUDIX hydrolase [Nocardioidaceae bacterium]